MSGHGSAVYFGLSPMWVSTVILAVTYAIIMSEKINRAIIALIGASVMILVGVFDQEEAIKGIDWNTIGLLTGMMILVSISRRSGMFQYIAIWSAQAAKAHPAGILFLLQITTAVLSAFLDNVTTVLLIVPVTLAIAKELEVPAYPFLFAKSFASNIGGTATLIGDPPNILIGTQVGLSFNEFVIHLTPVIIVVMVAQAIMIHLLWGKDLKATPGARGARDGDERRGIDQGLAAAQAVAGRHLGGDAGIRAGAAAASSSPPPSRCSAPPILMLLDNWAHHTEKAAQNIHQTFGDVEWITIFFFVGLFMVVHGVEQAACSSCWPKSSSRRPAAAWRPPATPSCGRRRSSRRSSTTSRSSPP
jgi:Na+/H+ antiporter NhaD/arsenite permease-like protein